MTTTELQTTGAMEFRITDPVDFIQAIHFNKDELMEAIKARVARYEGVTYTANTIKQAKSDRAELNKLIKVIEDKRKEIKKQLLQPYEDFEAEVKELLEIIKEPTEMIDKQVKDYEKKQKDFKKSQLKAQFDEDGDAKYLSGKVEFEDVFEERYLNVSVTLASAWCEIKEKLEKIRKDVELIESDTSVYKHTLMSLYMSTHDITRVMTEKKKFEEIAAAEEKRKAEEAAAAEEKRKAEEAAAAEEKRKAEEAAAAEEKRKAEEAAAEEKRKVEEAVAAEEKRKAEEAERQRAAEEVKAKSEAESKKGGDTTEEPEEQPDTQEITDTDMDGEGEGQHDKTRPENIYSALFSASGTRDQLAGLVRYMSDNGISWRQLPASPEHPAVQAG